MGQGLLVIGHCAKVARVKPVFKEVELNRGAQWRRNANATPCWVMHRSANVNARPWLESKGRVADHRLTTETP
jgi:hypothetical protein